MNIQITGASGSGKTFLGRELSKTLKCNFIDTDDILWLWDENIQPYTVAVSDEESCKKLMQVILSHLLGNLCIITPPV